MSKLFGSAQKVYSIFEKNVNANIMKFKIQDLSEDLVNNALEFYVRHFYKNETIFKAAGAVKEEHSEDILNFNRYNLQRINDIQVIVGNHDLFDSEIFGISATRILHKNDETSFSYQFTTPEVQKAFEIYADLEERFNVFDKFGVQDFQYDCGMTVHSQFHGLGLATELLKARVMKVKQEGVKLSVAWCSSLASITLAKKVGFRPVFEVSTDILAKRHKISFDFPGAPETFVFVVKEI